MYGEYPCMQPNFHDIIAAVVSGNATPGQQQAFAQLMANDDAFPILYQQSVQLYNQPKKPVPTLDTDAAFAQLKRRLGR
jgi:hypothetical protein